MSNNKISATWIKILWSPC